MELEEEIPLSLLMSRVREELAETDYDEPLMQLKRRHEVHFDSDDELPLKRHSVKEQKEQVGNKSSLDELEVTPPSPSAFTTPNSEPSSFSVDGSSREDIMTTNEETGVKVEAKRKIVKVKRNSGKAYMTEKSGKQIPERSLKIRCPGIVCKERSLQCEQLSEEQRLNIFSEFWRMGDLSKHRHWIHTHIRSKPCSNSRTPDSKRKRTMEYYLPNGHEAVKVCKLMFINTLGISDKIVRTVQDKADAATGVLGGECRGGRVFSLRERDAAIRDAVAKHINMFPRTESHYCRKNSKREYLHPSLTVTMMFDMFKDKFPDVHCDYSTYFRVFKSMNLSFHQPKKDKCNLCDIYERSTPEQKEELENRYTTHIAERNEVRNLKNHLKENSDPSVVVATFDLEQVIYLPKTNRCEVFYKRTLSNYNFTVYNLKSKKCNANVWHEGLAKRGANEISSCLLDFLEQEDRGKTSTVHLFCDSCSGQNRNTIIPAMLLYFVNKARSIKEIFVNFFEPHHGQNEGDAVHSCVERALRRQPEVMVPSELTGIIRGCRKTAPTVVREVCTYDVGDWKDLSQSIGILKVRRGHDMRVVDWTRVKSITVSKEKPFQTGFKMSHLDEQYSYLRYDDQRGRRVLTPPTKAYCAPPKLQVEKYKDLLSLMDNDLPVIRHPDHQRFYKSLPH